MANTLATRETVMTAFLALLQKGLQTDATPPIAFNVVSRRVKMWDDVPAEEQPACFIMEHSEEFMPYAPGTPRRLKMAITLFIYARAPEGDDAGAPYLNNLIDLVQNTIQPQSGGVQTLSGTVSYVRIEGRVAKDPGDLEGQMLAILPVQILVP